MKGWLIDEGSSGQRRLFLWMYQSTQRLPKGWIQLQCLKDCIRKIDQCGKAIYLLCRKADPMKYGTNGVATLTKHVQSFSHVQREVKQLISYKIPGTGAAKNVDDNYEGPPMLPIHLQLQNQQQHLNQPFTLLIVSAILK